MKTQDSFVTEANVEFSRQGPEVREGGASARQNSGWERSTGSQAVWWDAGWFKEWEQAAKRQG